MRKIKYSLFTFLLFFSSSILAQEKASLDFYPLEVGDFIEYKASSIDIGVQTIYREVISDTVLSNGMNYKIVKLCGCNSRFDLEPTYTFERKDEEGKIYIYYNNEDILLYNFNLESGTIYTSPYENLNWQIVIIDKETISMILIDEKENWIRQVDFNKEIGPINFYNLPIDIYTVDLGYWASIINGERKGKLFSIKDSFLSDKYYPLNTGDIFVYIDCRWFIGEPMPCGYIIKRVLEDTVLNDGYSYKKIKYELTDLPDLYPDYAYERKDKDGNIYESNGLKTGLKLKSTFCLGDTFYSNIFYENYNEPWYVWQKSASDSAGFVDYQMVTGNQSGEVWLFNKLGVLGYGSNTLERGGELLGAIINGELWGDTSTVTTGVDENNIINNYGLSQNYPNPFNPTTQINYSLQESNFVNLKVYNSIGELVSTLINEEKPAGSYSVSFNASGLPSGVYFYRITSGSFNQTRKMILLR